ncbi:FtsX-like permease family protein, partial [Planctomycetota bacterium]
PPLTFNNRFVSFRIENRPLPLGEQLDCGNRVITPAYFQCLDIGVLSGRVFTPADDAGKPVMVVNEAFVDQYFPRAEPIGKLITCGDETMEIVGVVGNVKTHGLQSEAFVPIMYRPLRQARLHGGMTLLLRTTGDPREWVTAVKREIWDIDSIQPISRIQTVKDIAADSVSVERFCMILLALMAGVALLISLVGLYGIVTFTVNERRNEIGIRMALGADQRSILILVMKQGVCQIILGLTIGLAGALAVTRCLTSMLYQTNAIDTITLMFVSIVLLAVALLACYIPARKATRVDPMEVLRHE